MEPVNDALTQLLIERHHAVVTPERPALVRSNQLLASERDAARLPDSVARWLEPARQGRSGVARLPIRTGDGVNVLELLHDIGERYRTLSVSPNHILRGAPSTWGGPADTPTVLKQPIPEPPSTPGARPVTVAILDTGISPHPWFLGKPWFADVSSSDHEVL